MPTIHRTQADDACYAGLVRSAARGDRQAFDDLTRRHEAEMRSFLRRRVTVDDVEDLLQDIWLAAWSSLAAYSGRSRFKTWLYSIAVFKVRDLYRRRSRDQAWVASESVEESVTLDDPFESEVRRQWVHSALDTLTADQRQLLELYYFAELTLPEIAVVLKVPLNPIKHQFYRAHKDLAEYMKGLGPNARGAESGRGTRR